MSAYFQITIGHSIGVWSRELKRQASDEHIPDSFFALATAYDLREIKRLATRLDRFQYHLVSSSNEKWSVQNFTLQCLDKFGSPVSERLCGPPVLLPGGRYVVTAAQDSNSHCRISLWDLQACSGPVSALNACSDTVLNEHEIQPFVSLDIQSDTRTGAILAACFDDGPRYV